MSKDRSYLLIFFYYKQKTAYEMRISDWSSDVCSPIWERRPSLLAGPSCRWRRYTDRQQWRRGPESRNSSPKPRFARRPDESSAPPRHRPRRARASGAATETSRPRPRPRRSPDFRSEEHTYELQSLTRISYAVFCLKNKKQ